MAIAACLTFDFDALSLWLGSFRSTSPAAISRGEFGAVGAERLLELMRGENIRSTWFIPGHTAETFPALCRRIADEGHEIAHHNYCHENPSSLAPEDEARIIDRGIEALEKVTGRRPRGFRSPAGDLSPNTIGLLNERGFAFDSSLLGNDFTPYRCRLGDRAPRDARFEFGREIAMVEIPFSWSLDDFPVFEPIYGRNMGLRAPSEVYEMWAGDFDYLSRRVGDGVFCLTMHPQCIGRGHRMLMLERLIGHIREHRGVKFTTMSEVAADFQRAHPLAGVPRD